MAGEYIEPWLRGPLADVHPLVAPTLHAYAQAREDLAKWTDGLTDAEIWSRPHGLAPVGFHLRHIAGSVERLTAYIRGERLTPQQLDAIHHEMDPGTGRLRLLDEVNEVLQKSEQVIRSLDPALLAAPRGVGRKQLPTTVIGLVVHVAEHTQRHVGELIVTSKLAQRTETGRTRPNPS
jgi:DinB superfamily